MLLLLKLRKISSVWMAASDRIYLLLLEKEGDQDIKIEQNQTHMNSFQKHRRTLKNLNSSLAEHSNLSFRWKNRELYLFNGNLMSQCHSLAPPFWNMPAILVLTFKKGKEILWRWPENKKYHNLCNFTGSGIAQSLKMLRHIIHSSFHRNNSFPW